MKVLLHMPHVSLKVPKWFYKGLTISKEEFRKYNLKMADLGVDELFKDLKGIKVSPKYSRMFCDVEKFKVFEEACGGYIKEVSLAYEENGKELSNYLFSKGIVASLGHTNATAKEVIDAASNGVTSATHTYNAMKGLHHREAGTVGGVMLCDNIYAELICDLIHVSEEAIQVLYQAKGQDKITLITDGIEAKHLPDGTYKLGGQDVFVKGKEARLENGTLAGSTLKMNEAVRNAQEVLNLSMEKAVDLATINPAKVLKIDDKKGSIALGKDADFAVVDKDFNVYMTVSNGQVIYKKGE